MREAKYMAHEVRRMGNMDSVGNADVKVRLLLLETLVKPSLLANVETWSNITKEEEKMITKAHHHLRMEKAVSQKCLSRHPLMNYRKR